MIDHQPQHILKACFYRSFQEKVYGDADHEMLSPGISQMFTLLRDLNRYINEGSKEKHLDSTYTFIDVIHGIGYSLSFFAVVFKTIIIAASFSLIHLSVPFILITGTVGLVAYGMSGIISLIKLKQLEKQLAMHDQIPVIKETVHKKCVQLLKAHFIGETKSIRIMKKFRLRAQVGKWCSKELERELPHIIADLQSDQEVRIERAIERFHKVYQAFQIQAQKKKVVHSLSLSIIVTSVLTLGFSMLGLGPLALICGVCDTILSNVLLIYNRGIENNRGWKFTPLTTLPGVVKTLFKIKRPKCSLPPSPSAFSSLEIQPSLNGLAPNASYTSQYSDGSTCSLTSKSKVVSGSASTSSPTSLEGEKWL